MKEWMIGERNDDGEQWKAYSSHVVVTGTMPRAKNSYNIVMMRFFQNHEVEAKLIPDRGVIGLPHHRVDELFFCDRRVMRQIGE